MSEPTYKVQRQQYCVDTTGLKYKTRAEILDFQRKWNTFEQIENYNDIIFQRFQAGLRDKPYYQFASGNELKDYRAGQELHVLKYPSLPSSTFVSISNLPIPDVPVIEAPPAFANLSYRCKTLTAAADASATTINRAETALYTYVSTFNATHHYQYNFVSTEEQTAYNRIRRQVECANVTTP
jgi:hypothetical protein